MSKTTLVALLRSVIIYTTILLLLDLIRKDAFHQALSLTSDYIIGPLLGIGVWAFDIWRGQRSAKKGQRP